MGEREVRRIWREIKKLSPPDKLRLAADLLEQRKAELAYSVAELVTRELGAALALDAAGRAERDG